MALGWGARHSPRGCRLGTHCLWLSHSCRRARKFVPCRDKPPGCGAWPGSWGRWGHDAGRGVSSSPETLTLLGSTVAQLCAWGPEATGVLGRGSRVASGHQRSRRGAVHPGPTLQSPSGEGIPGSWESSWPEGWAGVGRVWWGGEENVPGATVLPPPHSPCKPPDAQSCPTHLGCPWLPRVSLSVEPSSLATQSPSQ